MSEEDEIRDAVVALLKAQESGQDISELLPSAEGFPLTADEEAPEQTPEQALGDAVERALAFVRSQSRASKLASPGDWADAGLVPDSLDPEDVEMAVYDRLMAYKETCDLDESLGDRCKARAEAAANASDRPDASPESAVRRNPHAASAFSSSPGRPVGLSGFKHRKAVGSKDAAGETADAAPIPLKAVEGQNDELAPIQSPDSACNDFDDCRGIRLLMGAHSYYLYDEAAMTDAYARWAFLAAEDDPVAAFLECVRDESRIYPRPLARTNLANPPFCMDAEAVEAAWRAACDQGRADDVRRIEATNGAVYFYSTDYLSPARAQSLAQYDAVERAFNV